MVELEYRVASENARAFHNVMQNVQRYGQRNGRLWLVDWA